MSNQRAPGQKAVIVMMSDEFISLIDRNLSRLGFADRSSFIREAVRLKLGDVATAPESLSLAPSRAGKGGRPRKTPVALVSDNIDDYITPRKSAPKDKSKPKPKKRE